MTKKILLNLIGVVAVLLAILGVFLPLLPTTPFLLLASACFLRSSGRMHTWLHQNKVFGPYLTAIEAGRGIPLRAKIIAITLLWASIALSAWRIPLWWVQCLLLIPGIWVTIYLLRMKTLRPAPPD